MDYLIYGCAIIPVIAIIFLSWMFPKRTTIPERVFVVLVPLIAIIVGKIVSTATMTCDTEYWNSYGIRVEHEEPWETYVDQTCYREVCTGSGDNETCVTESYDCSYCSYHPEIWTLYNNIGQSYSISRNHYQSIVKKWENESFKDMQRSIHHSGFCGKDGDAYFSLYKGEFEKTVPICVQRRYENKVQCSKSIFNYNDVDSETVNLYGLYRYPNYENMGIFGYNPLIGLNNQVVSQRLNFYNAHLGSSKQVHMMIVVFHNQPVDAAIWQEAHWKNGNKNEFILCIGEKGGKIDWAKVISWTEVEDLKVRVARIAKEKALIDSLSGIVDMMAGEVKSHYIRKQFADFSYLKVEPTIGAVIWIVVITTIVTVGIGIIAIKNDFNRN